MRFVATLMAIPALVLAIGCAELPGEELGPCELCDDEVVVDDCALQAEVADLGLPIASVPTYREQPDDETDVRPVGIAEILDRNLRWAGEDERTWIVEHDDHATFAAAFGQDDNVDWYSALYPAGLGIVRDDRAGRWAYTEALWFSASSEAAVQI
ncbi:MAG: hypothetical protein KJO07_08560, partial [Deltaproteobacteria bacterium]|nr:hypothetical protein [Deltaproteobacteria bacterium]